MAPGVELAAAYVSLTVSSKGIAQNLQRELGDPVDKAAKDAGNSIEQGIGGGANRAASAAKVALSAIGSAAVLSGINKAKDAASGLQQAVGGTAAVFGEASDAVDDFAAGAAEAVGLSERAARELTSQLGASLKGYGFAVDEAAAKSIELTEVGADLAATFGGTTADAVAALSSALRGEFDPLERFGIALRQSAIDAEAVALGLVGAGEEVSSLARAQAALALITEQSGGALGQFARESDSAAGQAQIASAKMEDSAANLGEALLPIYAQLSETVGTVATVFAGLPGAVQTGILALAGIVAVAGPLTNVVGLVRSFTPVVAANTVAFEANTVATSSAVAVQNLYAVSTTRAAIATGVLSTALKVGAAAFAGYAIGAGVVNESRRRAQSAAEEEADQLRDTLGSITSYQQFQDQLNASIGRYNELVDDANSGADIFRNDDLAEYSHVLGPVLEQNIALNDVILAYTESTGDADEATRLLAGHAEETALLLADGYTPSAAAAEIANAAMADEAARAAVTTEDVGTEARTAADRLDAMRTATEGAAAALEGILGISDSLPVLRDNFDALLRGVGDEAERLNEDEASGDERRTAFLEFLQQGTSDISAYGDALLEQGRSTEEVRLRTQEMVQDLFEQSDAFGVSEEAAETLRAELGLLPEQIDIEVRSNAAFIAADFERLRAAAINFGFSDFLGQPLLRLQAGQFQARASGGDFDPGWLLAGEQGPELIHVGSPGTVVNAPDTAALMAGPSSGGDTYYISGPDPGWAAREVQHVQKRRQLVNAGGW